MSVDHTNSISRTGANQYESVLKALLPDYFKLDERKDADLILFAKNYAAFLDYYNEANQKEGDWTAFMDMDVSVILAHLAKLEVRSYFLFIKRLLKQIEATNRKKELQLYYTTLFRFFGTVVEEVFEQIQGIPSELPISESLKNIVAARLKKSSLQLKAYYDFSVEEGLITTEQKDDKLRPPLTLKSIKSLFKNELWQAEGEAAIPEFEDPTVKGKIKNISGHTLFKNLLKRILKALGSIVIQADKSLEDTLERFPKHHPHYALYLTFIKLFRRAQDQLNQFTKRHLDFYYKDVLRLEALGAQPDRAFLLFELQKSKEQHLLEAGTLFKAGKNDEGKERYYTLTDDIIINQGKVSQIKSVSLERKKQWSVLNYVPVTNSADGHGAAFESDHKSWSAFGSSQTHLTAETGFAIAHPILLLKEGERTIKLTLELADSFKEENLANEDFTAYLTGEEDWYKISLNNIKVKADNITLTIKLSSDAPAILPFNAAIHGQNSFDTNFPVIKIRMKNQARNLLQEIAVQQIKLEVDVKGVKDLVLQNDFGPLDPSKPFEIFGPQPYIGSSFIMGSKEVLLKKLDNLTLNVHWDNTDLSDYDRKRVFDKKVGFKILKEGKWNNLEGREKTILRSNLGLIAEVLNPPQNVRQLSPSFKEEIATQYGILKESNLSLLRDQSKQEKSSAYSSTGSFILRSYSIPQRYVAPALSEMEIIGSSRQKTGNSSSDSKTTGIPEKERLNLGKLDTELQYDFSPNAHYTVRSQRGFLKMLFKGPEDFGHTGYPKRLLKAAKKENAKIPNKPYTPKVKGLSMDYKASADCKLNTLEKEEVGNYYHLTPFGFAERNQSRGTKNGKVALIPNYENEGEIYIGISQFEANQTLSLLFKVADGSANPTLKSQKVHWRYLGEHNQWKDFNEEAVADQTHHLTKTGIIKYGFPREASNYDTIMGGQNLYWIKGCVKEHTDAICDLIEIKAQAAVVELTEIHNNGISYQSPLPAGSISKLKKRDSAVKKIIQPYSSFDGKVMESDDKFYIRTAERLRHKKRGITIWDYEHLILQGFPEIYKVKCIPHAKINYTKNEDMEMAPGHVLVVPVPCLSGKNPTNPFRPLTDIGTLRDIEQFLFRYISPFVQLEGVNPKFEEIKLDFNVRFYGQDTAYYKKKLDTAIAEFLSPWVKGGEKDIAFEGKMSKSVLLNFIEKQDEVDYVTDFKMYHYTEDDNQIETDEAIATSSRTIFVSFEKPNKNDEECNHKIKIIEEDN